MGIALATVINISLYRRNRTVATKSQGRRGSVSPRMLYEMGRRYDEWSGESYEGTSLRGGMKGWHKHGVTTEKLWPYQITRNGKKIIDREFSEDRAKDALRRPIGAYYRIVDSDVSHVQAAIVEGDAVLASSWVHAGWEHESLTEGKGGLRRIRPQTGKTGLHAFAIIGYTSDGFIIQNSWGTRWGSKGHALLSYEDWYENRQDAWVARPGPETRDSKEEPKIFVVRFAGGEGEGRAQTASSGLDLNSYVLPYLINTGDRGELSPEGQLATKKEELPQMARQVLTTPVLADGFRHVILYAHGGLNSESFSAKTASRLWSFCRQRDVGAYFFIWESGVSESVLGWLKSDDDVSGPVRFSLKDAWESIKKGTGKIVRDAQEILGEKLKKVVRKVFWDEMKGRAQGASTNRGGAALFARQLFQVMARAPGDKYKVHLVGHSAGSIYLGFLYQNALRGLLAGAPNVTLASIQFMAPAITIDRTKQAFFTNAGCAVSKGRFLIYMLKSEDEENDNIKIYPSSLLTYVADHLEDNNRRVPLLGIRTDFESGVSFATPVQATSSVRHGDFDDEGREVEMIIHNISQGKF